tara:strand:+ start:151 stop:336 length:186 start_codon:yes stop_codon:yes gene_type:complete
MTQKYDSVIVHNGREIKRLSKKINKIMWFLSVLIVLNLIAIAGIVITMLTNFNLTDFGVIK